MAEDQSQRPFRGNQSRPDASAPGSDPLAELARLIGQTDPFSEFGRHNARQSASRSAAPQQPAPLEYAPRPAETVARAPSVQSGRDYYAAQDAEPQLPLPEAVPYTPASYGRQAYGSAPLATGNDLYQVENDAPAYQDAADGGYETDPYQRDHQQDPYDDVPPSRRRTGIVVIAGIFALAVVGTAGAFGYRAIFGSSGSSGPPPVIKAETAPSKIVPAAVANKDPNKQITDRVNEGGAGERLVSRQEAPVDVNRTAGSAFPPPQAPVQGASQPALGSGVVGAEPKRVRTISIMPDQVGAGPANAMPAPGAPSNTASTPPRVVNITPARPNSQPAADVDMTRPQAAPRPAPQPAPPPVQQQAAAPVNNAPLSLSPNATAPRAPAPPPARTASAPPTQLAPAATAATGGFAVQLTSQRSEAEAQSAFRALQARFPQQLGNQQVLVRRVDLGDKGIYYRAMVGPFANGSDATGLCSSLKAAGGQCIVQKN